MKSKIQSRYYILLIACLPLLSVQQVCAQDDEIKELIFNNSLMTKTSVSKKTSSINSDRTDFYNLALELQPSIYIENNSVKKLYGHKKPLKIVCVDVNSFNRLQQTVRSHRNVDILEIYLKSPNDLNISLDLLDSEGIGHIKYIYVKSNFKITEAQMKSFIKISPDSDIRVFYKTEIPS